MPNPADVVVKNLSPRGGEQEALREQVNNLTTSLRALCAKLDADSGVADTDYAATITDAGVATAPRVIDAR